MITQKELLFSGLIPVLLAVGVLLVRLLLPQQNEGERSRVPGLGALFAALALSGAYLAAHAGLVGAPNFPPMPAEHGLFWIALIGLGVAAIGTHVRGPRWIEWPARFFIASWAAWLIAERHAELAKWGTLASIGWIAGLGLGIAAFWSLIEFVSRKVPFERQPIGGGMTVPFLLSMLVGMSVGVLELAAGYALSHQLSGALAGSLFVVALASKWGSDITMSRGGSAVIGLLLPSIWIDAIVWGELHWGYAVAMALTPIGMLVGDLPVLRKRPKWVRLLARMIVVGTVMGACIGVALMNTDISDY